MSQRGVEHSSSQLPCLAPSPEQVEIDLIGLAPGDPVMVCVEQQLAPRLVNRFAGVAGTVERLDSVRNSRRRAGRSLPGRFACLVSMKETSFPV